MSSLEESLAERERVVAMLEWTVSDLTKQLEAASGDMDMALQIQVTLGVPYGRGRCLCTAEHMPEMLLLLAMCSLPPWAAGPESY